MENNQDKNQKLFIAEAENMTKRIIDSKLLAIEDITPLSQYGVTTGLVYINKILKTIEEKGEKAAGKIFDSQKIDLILNLMNTEYYFRTSNIYAQGEGLSIPVELELAHLKMIQVIYDLETDMVYGDAELSTEINQRELAYLFAALSHNEIFHSSPNLLSQSLESITNYSVKSFRRVILDMKKTKGGWPKDEKQKLLKKISDIINSF
jgi:hypothetical protein